LRGQQFSADVPGIVDPVTTHCPSYVVGCCLLGMIGTHYAQVGGFCAVQELADVDESHGVSARNGGCALCQAMDLDGIRGAPQVAIAAAAEFHIFGYLPCIGV